MSKISLLCVIPKDFAFDEDKWPRMLNARWQGILEYYRVKAGAWLDADPYIRFPQAPWTLAEMRQRTLESNVYLEFQSFIEPFYPDQVQGLIVIGAAGFAGQWIKPKAWWFQKTQHYFAMGDNLFTSWLSSFPDSGVSNQAQDFMPWALDPKLWTPDGQSGILAHELGHALTIRNHVGVGNLMDQNAAYVNFPDVPILEEHARQIRSGQLSA